MGFRSIFIEQKIIKIVIIIAISVVMVYNTSDNVKKGGNINEKLQL